MTVQSPPTNQKLVAEWNLRDHAEDKVVLTRERDRFNAFSGENLENSFSFRSLTHHPDYVENLTRLFPRTVQANLETRNPDSSCFFPKLCKRPENEPDLQVALFGHNDTFTDSTGIVSNVFWGVLDTTGAETTIPGRVDSSAGRFIKNAPSSNQPDPDEKKHYAFDRYSRRFKVFVSRNTNQQIRSIDLVVTSLLDDRVQLTENNWAVTPVSALNSGEGSFIRALEAFFLRGAGHAMVAYEGIDEEGIFLRYVHAVQSADKTRAQIIFEKNRWIKTINGPTWPRTKLLVENMLSYARQLERTPLKFALSGDFFWHLEGDLSLLRKKLFSRLVAPIILSNERSTNERYSFDLHEKIRQSLFEDPLAVYDLITDFFQTTIPSNCLGFQKKLLEKTGISPRRDCCNKRIPIQEIRRLNQVPAAIMPDEFNQTSLGTPFSGENVALRTEMLQAGVLLSPYDSSPQEAALWMRQWRIEDSAAKNRITRLMHGNAEIDPESFEDTRLGIWTVNPYTYRPE